jgi:tetratricopeptide (TPR) repeat protein
MPRKKKAQSKGKPTLPRRLIEGIYQASEYLEEGKPTKARDLLEELDKKHPGQAPVLELLTNAYYDLQDMRGYEGACYRLIKVNQNNPEAVLASAGSYMANFRPALAIRAFQNFTDRWPGHERAGEAQKTMAQLRGALQKELSELKLPEEEAFELALQHEEVRFYLDHAQWHRGKQLAVKLLGKYTNFVPAINNMSQLFAIEGEFDRGIEFSRRALDIEPDNVHALSNLVRLLFLTGQQEEALSVAEQLIESSAEAADFWTKKAEALSFLGEDDQVLELYEQAKQSGELREPGTNPLFYHLVAVATFRKGKEQAARSLWKEALTIDPAFTLARDNLDDLDLPIHERNAPWSFALRDWIPERTVRELTNSLAVAARRKSERAVESASLQFLEKHPELIILARHLLERSDHAGREFVINLAAMSDHPELLAAVKDFALSQRGSDELRMKASQILSERGLMPSGAVPLWVQGEWKDILLLNFEVTDEPEGHYHSSEVESLVEQAIYALRSRDGKLAQQLLERAIDLEPDSPSLFNNLALALEMQGKAREAHAMMKEIHARYPDYLFGIIGVARLAIKDGDLETAHTLLNDLLQRRRLHFTEFEALCSAQIEFWLADKNKEAARTWFDMWEHADPENPDLDNYRLQLGKPFPPSRLFDRLSRKSNQ